MRARSLLRAIVSNPHYKLVSGFAALMMWLYVQGQLSIDGVVRAEVSWQLPPGLVATEPLPSMVSMAVTGPRAAIRRAERSTPSILIDLSELETGAHLIEMSAYPVRGVDGLSLSRLSPSSVGFSLDELSSRMVVVDPVLVGTPREGFRVASALPDPLVIAVRGAQSAVQDRVEVSTRPIDISGLSEDAVLMASLDLPTGVERVGDEVIEVHITVEAESDSRRFRDVPIVLWPLDAARIWVAQPATVTVELEGDASSLRGIYADDIVVFAHLPESATRGSYTLVHGPEVGPRLRVLHGGGESVDVVGLAPKQVQVVRQ